MRLRARRGKGVTPPPKKTTTTELKVDETLLESGDGSLPIFRHDLISPDNLLCVLCVLCVLC